MSAHVYTLRVAFDLPEDPDCFGDLTREEFELIFWKAFPLCRMSAISVEVVSEEACVPSPGSSEALPDPRRAPPA